MAIAKHLRKQYHFSWSRSAYSPIPSIQSRAPRMISNRKWRLVFTACQFTWQLRQDAQHRSVHRIRVDAYRGVTNGARYLRNAWKATNRSPGSRFFVVTVL